MPPRKFHSARIPLCAGQRLVTSDGTLLHLLPATSHSLYIRIPDSRHKLSREHSPRCVVNRSAARRNTGANMTMCRCRWVSRRRHMRSLFTLSLDRRRARGEAYAPRVPALHHLGRDRQPTRRVTAQLGVYDHPGSARALPTLLARWGSGQGSVEQCSLRCKPPKRPFAVADFIESKCDVEAKTVGTMVLIRWPLLGQVPRDLVQRFVVVASKDDS